MYINCCFILTVFKQASSFFPLSRVLKKILLLIGDATRFKFDVKCNWGWPIFLIRLTVCSCIQYKNIQKILWRNYKCERIFKVLSTFDLRLQLLIPDSFINDAIIAEWKRNLILKRLLYHYCFFITSFCVTQIWKFSFESEETASDIISHTLFIRLFVCT